MTVNIAMIQGRHIHFISSLEVFANGHSQPDTLSIAHILIQILFLAVGLPGRYQSCQ